MQPRIEPFGTEIGPKFARHIIAASKAAAASAVPAATLELVNIRASQINGCGGCLDMHTKEAARAGETTLRLSLVAAWRDTTVFTGAERAALELTEQGTRLADGGGVTDEAWAKAAEHYDDEALMALVSQIAVINAFNRMNVMTRQQGGGYEPGQHI
ncbi:carboxymuconolactone decarboxylase family protein [Streptomyces cocklensis]|uniref:AhpD family alkylhydroperoxidase n=1 Tax=Actinacidiphila cocklensis TaxID=887465 RepID=A0A9W4DPH0_9ACTN|nr:carboxymuconolactone decarboxylase family protein [Actinacidiphila cocklensis]MDD1063225.1 carboxymuconolactone decarboxylase family protein [Actinacidiphila cocklensis]WSX74395.1 carboxymuconolactone decarboxylase family protein [Streptomyces sp. NBC_00899]CAG6393659.1 AhpD family alkylhydroperoxidase [Actinacidiphila cocklensis]